MSPLRLRQAARALVFASAILLSVPASIAAQTEQDPSQTATPPAATMFDHSDSSWWWASGQVNLINQWHGSFPSPYAGPNSFRATPERALSRVWTIYTGVQLTPRTEILFDVESAGGRGLSDALGLAGFTNLDVVRNPTLGAAPYLARLQIHQTIALSRDTVTVTRGPLSLATTEPARRIEIRAGKLSVVDTFDLNSVGSDSHLQFMNWTIDNDGAYDYAADTRGYTVGAIVEYDAPRWSLRGAEALMPKVANGITLDWDIARARGENVELELRAPHGLVARFLWYLNHADMGSYGEAVQAFRAGIDPDPDIVAHRRQGREKTGVGANLEYTTGLGARLFGRAGWNDGRNESFAYTEVDDTVELGGDLAGDRWHRPGDRVGVAGVSNGLSALHREYLALGGLGFLLGDGALRYGREDIVEAYYTARLWRGVFASGDIQHITNPGYNQDRGPIVVGTVRLHLDF